MVELAQYITPTLLFPLLVLVAVFAFFGYYLSATAPRPNSLDWIAQRENRRPLSFSSPVHPMEKGDRLPLLALTAVYAVTAFFQLGSFTNPQTFEDFLPKKTVAFELEEETMLSRVVYYPGLSTGSYELEYSVDGQAWTSLPMLEQTYADLFKWLSVEPEEGPVPARYFRLTCTSGGPELGELALYGQAEEGADQVSLLPVSLEEPSLLFDEQDLVPAESTYLNSTYFDEIYHGRTAYEHLRGVYPYEISHPPLGKLIIGLGIRLFGMTPFGWRFMGTLFGVAMLPLLYLFLKNLFGKTVLATCGTALFAFDFMHLTQTRIATIDTYAVFFILLMYLFFYRWLALPSDASFRQGALPLFLSGLSFGIGVSCKWTVIYAGAGLALLYLMKLILVWRDRKQGAPLSSFVLWAGKTILFSVLVFVLIPAVIYCLSYLPYAQAKGNTSLSSLLSIVWDNQKFMFTYHKGVTSPHPYSSRWWQWIFDIRPILYYRSEVTQTGLRSAFAAWNNPVVSWAGLLGIGVLVWHTIRRRSGLALFLLVGYLAQLVPWIPISRPTFAYHYFPATLFLVLAICYLMKDILERSQRWRLPVYGLTGLSVFLYGLFYPFLAGLMVPTWYTTWILQWLPSWPL